MFQYIKLLLVKSFVESAGNIFHETFNDYPEREYTQAGGSA
jgi:hypothetical protein